MTWYEFVKPTFTKLAISVILIIGLWLVLNSHKAKIRFFPCKTQAVVSEPKEYSKDICGLWQFTGGFTGIRIQLTPASFMVIGLVLVLLPYLASCMISYLIPGKWTDIDQKEKIMMGKKKNDSIGSARMETDGTVVLQLRAESPGGAKGDALFRYPPGHPEYKNVLQHLGGLEKGQEKVVPPWKGQK